MGRKSKELVRLLSADGELRRELIDVVGEADRFVKKESLIVLKEFLAREGIDLRLMSDSDVTSALKAYYKDARINGEFVKMS